MIRLPRSVGLDFAKLLPIDESIQLAKEWNKERKLPQHAEEPVDIYLFRAHSDAELRYAEATPLHRRQAEDVDFNVRLSTILLTFAQNSL